MKPDVTFAHQFVEQVPSSLEPGVLYVSIRYRTVVHLCACGCGNKVVTPIRPPRWHLTFDGETISLSPSVGSWQFPCRSHYWIDNNHVRWSKPWTEEQIASGRARDAADMRMYYEDRREAEVTAPSGASTASRWRRLLSKIGL